MPGTLVPGWFPPGQALLTGRPTGGAAPFSPDFTLQRALERVGGGRVHTLFDLTVTHPIPYTWHLALAPVELPDDPAIFDPPDVELAGLRYVALVREHSGVSIAAASGGVSDGSSVNLTLINAMGTWGPGRKFMDQFATPVPGYTVPYNLLTMTLTVRLYSERAPAAPLTIGGRMALLPEGFEITAAPGDREVAHLSFGPDVKRYREVPPTILTTKRYSHLPEALASRPLPVWFGVDLQVPLLPVDNDGALFVVGGSALDTPNGPVTGLWTIRDDIEETPDSPAQAQAWPVRITTGGEIVLSIPGNGTALVLRAGAELLEVQNTGAFLYGVRVWMKRAVTGTAAAGEIKLGLYTDEDGLPGSTLIDPAATADVDAGIVGPGTTFQPYDIHFQDAALQRAAYVFADKSIWLQITHTKNGGGDLHIELNGTGAYTDGYMATKATATDEGWVLDGKLKKRLPVAATYLGTGGLGRNVTTGVVALRPPVLP